MKTLITLIALLFTCSLASADSWVKISNREVKYTKTVEVEEVYNLDTLLSEKANIKASLDAVNAKITAVRNAGAVAESEVNA